MTIRAGGRVGRSGGEWRGGGRRGARGGEDWRWVGGRGNRKLPPLH